MKKIVSFSLIGIFLIYTIAFSSLISKVISSYTKTVTWYDFEPGDEFTTKGSQYTINSTVKMKYYQNTSAFLSQNKLSSNSLGVRFSWNRKANNYMDIIPAKKQEFEGAPTEVSLWVWGGNYMHELALLFARGDGYTRSLSVGSLDFYGWKKRKVLIPSDIKNTIANIEKRRRFFFDKFRIYGNPMERVTDIYVFMDKMVGQESLALRNYDGYDLEEVIKKEVNDTDKLTGNNIQENNEENLEEDEENDISEDLQEEQIDNEEELDN